jgi:hypothetical protein
MSASDKGILLERRTHRLAFHLGYFCRRRVNIYTSSDLPITDVDLIGIKFDDALSPQIVLFETKSSDKGFSSILKMKGMLEYYGALDAYIIRETITPDVSELAEQLGIKAMHTSRLDEIETELAIDRKSLELSFSAEFDAALSNAATLLKKNGFSKYLLLSEKVWNSTNPIHQAGVLRDNIFEISVVADGLGVPELQRALYLIMLDLLCHLARLLLSSANLMYTLPDHQRKQKFTTELVSGRLSKSEKDRLNDYFYSYISNYTRNILKQKFELKKDDFNILPKYSDDMYSLISRLIKKPHGSKHIARLFDYYFASYMLRKESPLNEAPEILTIDSDSYALSLKFCRDITDFVFGKNIPNPLLGLNGQTHL